jgi:predicted RNase H-like nuclease (RuvC/YqgF family)
MRGGQEIGAEHVERFKTYLESIDTLPARNGKMHVTAVAEAAGLDRQTLYKNQVIRKLFAEAVAQKGLRGIDRGDNQGDSQLASHLERKIADQDTRIKSLETKNASLMAENLELRRQLARLRHVEALMEQGRGVAP